MEPLDLFWLPRQRLEKQKIQAFTRLKRMSSELSYILIETNSNVNAKVYRYSK